MIYRNLARHDCPHLTVVHRHSHVRIRLAETADPAAAGDIAHGILVTAYAELDEHIRHHPDFLHSLTPRPDQATTPMIRQMLRAARTAGVGPMAAVAGALAEAIGEGLRDFCPQVMVENGGDLHIHTDRPAQVGIYPGWGGFSSCFQLTLPPGQWGVASSSGRFGHSFSQGTADMVTVVTGGATLADAYATALANRVVPGSDPAEILKAYHFLDAVAIVWQDTLWYDGDLDLQLTP